MEAKKKDMSLKMQEAAILAHLTKRGAARFGDITLATGLEFRAADRAMQRLRKKGLVTFSNADGWTLVLP